MRMSHAPSAAGGPSRGTASAGPAWTSWMCSLSQGISARPPQGGHRRGAESRGEHGERPDRPERAAGGQFPPQHGWQQHRQPGGGASQPDHAHRQDGLRDQHLLVRKLGPQRGLLLRGPLLTQGAVGLHSQRQRQARGQQEHALQGQELPEEDGESAPQELAQQEEESGGVQADDQRAGAAGGRGRGEAAPAQLRGDLQPERAPTEPQCLLLRPDQQQQQPIGGRQQRGQHAQPRGSGPQPKRRLLQQQQQAGRDVPGGI
ncbi:hypothetical protein AGOR_G00232370 [Albula goreensis]|uniref:Uncharacterized protein n=1 Tax=Albula goreensis TaxID=1534307 RepID=A0A8T3CLR7_9TELE|nr:hypothetical protein AGOR_G00232370 [Albula goreensis]